MFDRMPKVFGSVIEAALTPHPVDRYLELVDPMITWRDIRARVIDVHRPTARAVRLTLQPTRHWKGFTAGQYVQLSVVVDGVRQTRCFSPANAESGPVGRLELTVTVHDDGVVSRHLYDHAKVGDIVSLTPAAGDFTMPATRSPSMIFVSGGSGVTPVLSMLRTLVHERHVGRVAFVHYATGPEDVAYASEFADISRRRPDIPIHVIHTRETDGPGPRGHFTGEHLRQTGVLGDGPPDDDTDVYVCGPAGLMDDVRAYFDGRGQGHRVHSEAFTAPTIAAPDPGDVTDGTIRFTSSGAGVANDGRVLLEQAESAGLTPEFGCRMGICFSCSAPKKSGCTRNVLTGEIDSSADTHIQLCISAPVGDVDIDI